MVKAALIELLDDMVSNRNNWNSHIVISISNQLSELEKESGKDFADLHRRLGKSNPADPAEHAEFHKLLVEIREAIVR